MNWFRIVALLVPTVLSACKSSSSTGEKPTQQTPPLEATPVTKQQPASSNHDASAPEQIPGPLVSASEPLAKGTGKVEASVGPNGGSLRLGDAIEIRIPPGALDEDQKLELTLGKLDDRAKSLGEPIGPTFNLLPITVFNKPVSVVLLSKAQAGNTVP